MRPDGSVGRLLTRAFAVLVLLIVTAGVAQMVTVLVQHRTVDQLSAHVQPLQLANARLRGVLADAQRGLRGYLITGDGQLLDTYHAARSAYPSAVAQLRELCTSRECPAVTAQAARADAWWELAERQRRVPPRSTEAAAFVATGRSLFDQFQAANAGLDRSLAARADALQQRSFTVGRLTMVAVGVLTAFAAVLSAITAARTTRRITGPLGRLVGVLDRMREGDLGVRADPDDGPSEIRAVAAALNTRADEADRVRAAEREVARLRAEARELGNRIRGHLVVEDAVREAVQGLAATLQADRVLVRTAGGQTGAAPVEDARSVLTVEVGGGDDRVTALTLIRDQGPPWTLVEIGLAEAVADDLGRGVHHARLYELQRQLVARLQELDTAKTDFMSTVSHELRTPLTSITGYLELMLDEEAGGVTDAQRRMLEVIARNSRRLRELIEDMLTLSKIESGTFRITRSEVDLAAVVDHALATVAPAAAKASVRLHSEAYGPLPLQADPEQLDRVLMNLLTNAVKFTPAEGTVTVIAGRDGDHVVITVADTGLGIPEAEQQALFTRFFRASNAIHRAIPGTGLGLPIVRTIIDSHGGTIDVRSTENVGTTVTVRLPG